MLSLSLSLARSYTGGKTTFTLRLTANCQGRAERVGETRRDLYGARTAARLRPPENPLGPVRRAGRRISPLAGVEVFTDSKLSP